MFSCEERSILRIRVHFFSRHKNVTGFRCFGLSRYFYFLLFISISKNSVSTALPCSFFPRKSPFFSSRNVSNSFIFLCWSSVTPPSAPSRRKHAQRYSKDTRKILETSDPPLRPRQRQFRSAEFFFLNLIIILIFSFYSVVELVFFFFFDSFFVFLKINK